MITGIDHLELIVWRSSRGWASSSSRVPRAIGARPSRRCRAATGRSSRSTAPTARWKRGHHLRTRPAPRRGDRPSGRQPARPDARRWRPVDARRQAPSADGRRSEGNTARDSPTAVGRDSPVAEPATRRRPTPGPPRCGSPGGPPRGYVEHSPAASHPGRRAQGRRMRTSRRPALHPHGSLAGRLTR